jgi:large subunit ribosomal protein L23
MNLKPIVTEKAVMMIESQNTLTFETDKKNMKPEIRNEIESLFKVKVEGLSTKIHGNKKQIHAKLKKEFPAIDIATKLGII